MRHNMLRLCSAGKLDYCAKLFYPVDCLIYSIFIRCSFNGRLGARVAMTLRDSRNDLVNSCKQDSQQVKSD